MSAKQTVARALRPDLVVRRLIDFLGPTVGLARQSLIALGINSITSFAAGAMLVGFRDTWERYPPMLILIPAAIGLRGNVFTSMGNRLSTSIHTGTFQPSARLDSVLGQNLAVSFALTIVLSAALAILANVIAVGLGIESSVGVVRLMGISVLAGVGGSALVASATVWLSTEAVKRGWDLDNLVAPVVSTLGDVVTIPALWLSLKLLVNRDISIPFGWFVGLLALGLVVACWRAAHDLLRTAFRESLPVLAFAMGLSALAGLVLQNQQEILTSLPVVGALQPAFVSSAGALGAILAGRIATNLHLGVEEPDLPPGQTARSDISLVLGMAVPVILVNAVGAWLVVAAGSDALVNLGWVVLLGAGAFAATMLFVVGTAYYSTIAAWRLSVDPDSYGTPVVTGSVDFVGTMALVVAFSVL